MYERDAYGRDPYAEREGGCPATVYVVAMVDDGIQGSVIEAGGAYTASGARVNERVRRYSRRQRGARALSQPMAHRY